MKKNAYIIMVFMFLSLVVEGRSSSYPFIAGDTFRAIADYIIDEINQTIDPQQVKPYDIIFLKTDYEPNFFENIHPKINEKYILITHNSDLSPIYFKALNYTRPGHNMSQYLNDSKLVIWFAQNIDYKHPKLKPLPIGLANQHFACGNINIFHAAVKNIPPHDKRFNKIYLNFNIHNNVRERRAAMDFFSKQSYAYAVVSFKEPAAYLEEMKDYQYVLAPAGNGLDCHRTWEALLLGCIPIMKRSLLDPMFEDLPVILVDSWDEVTEEFLAQKDLEIKYSSYNLEKIYADYWISLIKSYQVRS